MDSFREVIMRRYLLPSLAFLASLLFSTCDTFDPQWAGVWVDKTTVDNVVITLDLEKWKGTVTVEDNNINPPPYAWLRIVKGDLDGDEDTLIATIRSIDQKDQNHPDGFDEPLVYPFLLAFVKADPPDGLGLPGLENAVSYTIEGDTLTLTGQLILVLTGEKDTLVAIRRP
jgi:hypothetical protein